MVNPNNVALRDFQSSENSRTPAVYSRGGLFLGWGAASPDKGTRGLCIAGKRAKTYSLQQTCKAAKQYNTSKRRSSWQTIGLMFGSDYPARSRNYAPLGSYVMHEVVCKHEQARCVTVKYGGLYAESSDKTGAQSCVEEVLSHAGLSLSK